MKNIFNKRSSSRKQIQIKEVVDNILILPNHKYCQILESSSLNFELKSEDEQDMIIDSFQNFLNSLPCPIQILVRVREIDIDKYIEELKQKKVDEKNKVYKEQIDEYCNFVKKLVTGNKILSRRFYIVIPLQNGESKDFKLIKQHLALQRDVIIKGMERMQMRARTLTSLEILNLFYGLYNPDQLKTQPITKDSLRKLLQDYV